MTKPEKIDIDKPEKKGNKEKEIAKLEKSIAQQEAMLEELRNRRFDPDYYHDYQKMKDLDEQIDEVHNSIESLMAKWEEYYA
ncbi:hypothetical protein SDC9_206360 [bioreactor metagenome]|uniref:ABC transporter Uup C-terminal domain-containing protein n=1 Tax=bioreactor metagenome TaxID=1076179 RepID=A0A645J686_9ZZZZ